MRVEAPRGEKAQGVEGVLLLVAAAPQVPSRAGRRTWDKDVPTGLSLPVRSNHTGNRPQGRRPRLRRYLLPVRQVHRLNRNLSTYIVPLRLFTTIRIRALTAPLGVWRSSIDAFSQPDVELG